MKLTKIFTACAILFLCLTSPAAVNAQEASSLNLQTLKGIPILHDGRVKPIETFARHVLLRFSGRTSIEKQSAMEWLARLLFHAESLRDLRVFLINHPETAEAIGLEHQKKRRYSFQELMGGFHNLERLARAADSKENRKDLTLVERELIRTYDNVSFYIDLSLSLRIFLPDDQFLVEQPQTRALLQLKDDQPCCTYADIILRAPLLEDVIQSLVDKDTVEWSPLQTDAFRLMNNVYQWTAVVQGSPFMILPAVSEDQEKWFSPLEAASELIKEKAVRDEIMYLNDLTSAYKSGDQKRLDRAAYSLTASIKERKSQLRPLKVLGMELMYNQLKPFFWAKILYLLTFLILLSALFMSGENIPRGTLALLLSGFFLHTFGIVARCWILARPPVTNLFETFIFVSWVCVLIGFMLGAGGGRWLGRWVGALAGAVFLMIAGKFSSDGDTMKMLVAVLNSNFWLMIHVLTITIGYAVCSVAGILGHVFLVQQIFKPKSKELLDRTFRALILTLGFGLTFAFFGTVLGGIWADQSWGRFWGWDPKENGALMIILWCSIIFHARISGMIRKVGFAAMSALGLIVVMWAWFGVNLLSVGLHSYGFTEGVSLWLTIFAGGEFLLVLILAYLAGDKKRRMEKAVRA